MAIAYSRNVKAQWTFDGDQRVKTRAYVLVVEQVFKTLEKIHRQEKPVDFLVTEMLDTLASTYLMAPKQRGYYDHSIPVSAQNRATRQWNLRPYTRTHIKSNKDSHSEFFLLLRTRICVLIQDNMTAILLRPTTALAEHIVAIIADEFSIAPLDDSPLLRNAFQV